MPNIFIDSETDLINEVEARALGCLVSEGSICKTGNVISLANTDNDICDKIIKESIT